MTNLLPIGWIQLKKQALATVAAALMFGGMRQILTVLDYRLSDYVTQFINLIIRQGFRDRMPLAQYGKISWQFDAGNFAVGVIMAVVGTFVGLWVHARSQRQPGPVNPLQKQSPRESEG